MKLVIYFESFPTSSNPYLGNYAIDMINDFLKRGFTLEILVILPSKKSPIFKESILNSENYKLTTFFYRSSIFRLMVPFQVYSFIITFFNSFNKRRILVNSTLLSAFAVYILSKINRKIKLYTVEHNSKITSGDLNFFYKIISKIIVKQKNHLLLSFFQKIIFESWINHKLNSSIISLPSSFTNLPLNPFSYTNDKDCITILCVAPLNERKGILDVLAAFSYLHINSVKCKLLIIGKGELHDFILDKYNFYIENNFLTIKNFLHRDALINEYSKTHFVISLSKFETFGLTIVEALLMGKFVIATKVGICTNGYCFEDLKIIDHNSDVSKQIFDIIVSYKKILSFERSFYNSNHNSNVYIQNQLALKIL
jgi:glycosyltransferase involved in cell wall biosynthesis